MKKIMIFVALAAVLSSSAVVPSTSEAPVVTSANAESPYYFVQCTGYNVYLRKGPGKNYAYVKRSNGKPLYANDPDEFEYLGVTKNGYHKIRAWVSSDRYIVAWISARYSYRY